MLLHGATGAVWATGANEAGQLGVTAAALQLRSLWSIPTAAVGWLVTAGRPLSWAVALRSALRFALRSAFFPIA